MTDHGGGAITFQCITALEVLEHIPADLLPALIDNITRHLTPGGILDVTVDTALDANSITGAVYHATLQPMDWSLAQFAKASFVECERHLFETRSPMRRFPTDGIRKA